MNNMHIPSSLEIRVVDPVDWTDFQEPEVEENPMPAEMASFWMAALQASPMVLETPTTTALEHTTHATSSRRASSGERGRDDRPRSVVPEGNADSANGGQPPVVVREEGEVKEAVGGATEAVARLRDLILAQILERADRGTLEEHRVEIEVEAAELGRVHVELRLRSKQVALMLTTQNRDATRLLQRGLQTLRTDLQNAGLSLGSYWVGDEEDRSAIQKIG